MDLDLITSAEVAEILGVSLPTVNRRAIAGDLPVAGRAAGRRGPRLFNRAEIERIAAELDKTKAAS